MNNNKLCENKKWELVNFCEFDKYAEKSYCAIHNVDSSKNLGDITKVDEENLSPFNMICGGSPCFVAGTKVFTKNGYKNIEDIKVGDMVLTHRNRFMPVLRNGGEVDKEIYKLKVQGFLETECTDYHPFYCRKTKNSEPEKIKLKDLKKGYYVGSHINTKSENTYNLSDEDCWILGRYIADGHIRKDKRKDRKNSYQYQCILSIGSNKVDVLKDIVKNRHYSCYPHAKSTHRVVFSSMELVEFILEHNFGTGAENKIIPNFILDLPVHKLECFLEGYMAGDGCNIGNIYQANATNADTKATTSHTKATEESTEATKKSMKTFDWVATKLETWEKKVKKISDQITDYITSALKTSLLKKQMKTMNYEMKANTKGELAYMKKANSVAEKYTYYNSDGGEINVSIPKKYQKLVQSGAYRIEDMDTSTDEGKALAEAISEYQSWYEKAQDCKQAVIDLRNEQQKLFEQWANMPTEKAKKKIDRLTTGYNGINAVSSRLTAATKGGSTQAVLAQTMKEDLAEAQEQKKSDNKALKSAKTANKKASSAKKKADNKVKSTAKSLLKTNLTDEQKKQVQAGKKIDSTGMSGSQKKKADNYNKAVTNKTKANKKATSAKSKLSTAKSNYNSSNSTYNSMKSNVNEALTAYNSGDSLSYMNSLVDQQVSGKKLEQEARKAAVEQANANLTTTKKQKTTSDKKLAKLQKKYKSSKNLTAAQKKKIAAGKEIDTTGITDAKQLKILTAYNNALADCKKKKENVTIATNALAEANENLMTAEVESAQATVEAVSTKFDNAKTYYEALLSYQEQLSKYQEKNIDLAKAHGDYEKSSDYDVKISNTQAERAIKQNELDELTKQLNDGVEAGTIVENSQEWLDMQTKIKEAQNAVSDYDTQIEELKQSQIGVYYEEQFDRAAEKVDRFRDKLDGLKSLISDDMKIDKNTGLLTESGALSITLDVDDINASTENLKTYIKERQQIINDYNAGKFGEDEYNQKLKDVDANIKSTTANIYSSRNSILELVKSQSQAELDVLNKVIDKRKEALSAKKNYYDYDKTLKNKTKDIEVLERQIAALEGSTSAEDKARKAKLQEQLQSAKDDLNDTIVDHAYSMQTDSLDKLSTDLSEDLDTWINKISSNMEDMTNAINGAISNAGLSTASTINAISSILRHYGLSDSEISQSGLTDIKGYASGTDYVNKSGMYRVNENGMESVLSRKYGTLTFLNQGDKVFDANFTKGLLDNATIATQKNMPDYAGMAKAIEKNIQNIQNMSGNTYVNNFYIDGAQDTDSILREIDRHLDRKIKAHDKKQVRDFRSLR